MIPKDNKIKIYTIVKGKKTFYRRHIVPVTSCSEVKYVLKRVSSGSKEAKTFFALKYRLTISQPLLCLVAQIDFIANLSDGIKIMDPKIVSGYDQEMPQSQAVDNPMAPRGRTAQPSRDTMKTNKAKQPALSSPSR